MKIHAKRIDAGEGRAHVACTTCGFVATVPLKRTEPTPWCVHAENYTWREPNPATQAGRDPWTRMVRVEVRPRA